MVRKSVFVVCFESLGNECLITLVVNNFLCVSFGSHRCRINNKEAQKFSHPLSFFLQPKISEMPRTVSFHDCDFDFADDEDDQHTTQHNNTNSASDAPQQLDLTNGNVDPVTSQDSRAGSVSRSSQADSQRSVLNGFEETSSAVCELNIQNQSEVDRRISVTS